MPETKVSEELEALHIQVQDVMEDRSRRRDKDAVLFIVSLVRGLTLRM
jgi:hypothetical protein